MMSDWKNELGDLLSNTGVGRVEGDAGDLHRFFNETALPAFEALSAELEKHGRRTQVRSTTSSATLTVTNNGEEEMNYRLQPRRFPNGVRPYAEVRFRERKGLKLITVESMVRSGSSEYNISDISKDEVIKSFLEQYKRRVGTA
ncbi:MAG: hypothetical protein ACI9OU_001753 [Candidatus Promineifilaceae bacterium]|jgi:choline/glycine/proline betaine transport protein